MSQLGYLELILLIYFIYFRLAFVQIAEFGWVPGRQKGKCLKHVNKFTSQKP